MTFWSWLLIALAVVRIAMWARGKAVEARRDFERRIADGLADRRPVTKRAS